MIYTKEHLKTIEKFVLQLMDKYSKRKSNFEPLTKILGDYANDTFLRAVRNVMFEKIPIDQARVSIMVVNHPFIWQIKRHADCPMNHNYVNWVAKKIINEQIRLRRLVWFLNGWGEPYPKHRAIRFDISPEACMNESFATFKMRCENKMAEYVEDVELREEIMRSIYEYGHSMREYGYAYGNKDSAQALKDKLVDIYNNIEFDIDRLRNIINE